MSQGLRPETMDLLRRMRELYAENGGWPLRVRDLSGYYVSSSTLLTHLRLLEGAGLVEKGPYPKSGWRPL